MISKLTAQLSASPTAYHAVDTAKKELEAQGYRELKSNAEWSLKKGDKAYTVIDGSALIAFRIGDLSHYGYNIVASHADSPCLKLKGNPEMTEGKYKKLNTEVYGSPMYFAWLDRPVGIAGRVIVRDKQGVIRSVLYRDSKQYVIPSVAIHLNRNVNKEMKLNAQTDLSPLFALTGGAAFDAYLKEQFPDCNILDYDLFVFCGDQPAITGLNGEFLCAPRLDNQTSAFASVEALLSAVPKGIAMIFIADNEEVGSRTKQGAGATILKDAINRIHYALGKSHPQLKPALANSFMVSCDNAHALHPNQAALSDPTNKSYMGDGIAIKHHANQNYTTDAFSAAVIKEIFTRAGAKFHDVYGRSDLSSGSTLGAISSSQLSIRSVDIGLPQLSMHSSFETMCGADYIELIKGLRGFLTSAIAPDGYEETVVQ